MVLFNKLLKPFIIAIILLPGYLQAQTSIGSLEKEMVLVQGGNFVMGCLKNRSGYCKADEIPAHEVSIASFYMSKFEVTQKLFKEVTHTNPSKFSDCDLCPVENVSWYEVTDFIEKLNQLTGKMYRLPTEAEWEFAARSGRSTKGFRYSGSNNIDEVAWYKKNSEGTTHPVGTKAPNLIGLYDMSGNVWEWCSDWYDLNYYTISVRENPQGPDSTEMKVIRAGSWFGDIKFNRIANRGKFYPDKGSDILGFRLAMSKSEN